MSVVRIREPNALRPLQVTMLCVLGATVSGGFLLLSAPESARLVDGAIPWHEQSLLRAFVQLLCLNYDSPTLNAGSVKMYILGLGSGLAVTTLGVALLAGGRADAGAPTTEGAAPQRSWNPLLTAKFLVLLFLLWSFASSRWSAAPDLAAGGSMLLVIHFLWALALGTALTPRAARMAVPLLVAVTAVAATAAVWYYYGRNPVIRAKFPFGNPQFLAACLIPGLLLAVSMLLGHLRSDGEGTRGPRRIVLVALALGTLLFGSWAFVLADTRGAMVGLGVGILAMVFFAWHGRRKLIPVMVTLVVVISSWVYFSAKSNTPSPTGRHTTIRFREYTWSYAWRMFTERPFLGHGQGGYVLRADSYAVDDVLADPEVFVARIAHAHSEWLEVLADLGAVGLVLVLGALGLTLLAGHAALQNCHTQKARWYLIGLLSSLVALIAEECTGVGLRVSGVPTVYYTIIGLIWACGVRDDQADALPAWMTQRPRRNTAGVVALIFGLIALALSQQDWSAARQSFRAETAFAEGDIETALSRATAATTRLNPQRALTNFFRLSEAHLRAAQMLQQRAMDRERRAFSSEPLNARLAALASEDYIQSDKNCQAAAGALRELVERSPGYLNHGQLEYLINLAGATNASGLTRLQGALTGQALDEKTQAQAAVRQRQFLKSAAAAAGRELRRQPFEPAVALNYAAAIHAEADLRTVLDILARPIRYNRIGPDLVRFLESLALRPDYDEKLRPIVEGDVITLSAGNGIPPDPTDDAHWAAERLRLGATVWFLRGDYTKARGALELVVQAYAAGPGAKALSVASAWAELADCRFFDTPMQVSSAIEAAQNAINSAPPSQPGRAMAQGVKQRLIQYLLASRNEPGARALLATEAPSGTSEQSVSAELGARYRRLCESLLARREGQLLRKPLDKLFPQMLAWNERSLALNPGDPLGHRLAADMAFHAGRWDEAAGHLEHAVERGLDVREALQFLAIARQQRPDSDALNALWARWSQPPPDTVQNESPRHEDPAGVLGPAPLPPPTP